MNKYFALLTISLFVTIIFAQTKVSTVSYTYNFFYRENAMEEYKHSEMSLITNGSFKYYLPKDKLFKIAHVEEEKYYTIGPNGTITITRETSDSKQFLIKNLRINENYEIIDINENKFYYADSENLKWEVKDSIMQSKKFGIPMQKAICHFKGRSYTAFFSTSIPINIGPYKFDNLPGILLKLSDSESNFIYELVSVEPEIFKESLIYPTKILENFTLLDKKSYSIKKDEIVKKIYVSDKRRHKEIDVNLDNGRRFEMKTRLQSDLMMEIEEK
jgi:GLPGLI family protein